MKNEKGITLIALTVTMIMMVLIAGISTTMLTGNNGLIDESKVVVTQTEISEVEQKIEEYVKKEQANRIANGDYSENFAKNILEQNNITTTIITTEGIQLGIIQDFQKIGFKNEKGQKGNEIVNGWVGSIADIKDVFAINYITNKYYYINEGHVWDKTGEINIATMMLDNLKQM